MESAEFKELCAKIDALTEKNEKLTAAVNSLGVNLDWLIGKGKEMIGAFGGMNPADLLSGMGGITDGH